MRKQQRRECRAQAKGLVRTNVGAGAALRAHATQLQGADDGGGGRSGGGGGDDEEEKKHADVSAMSAHHFWYRVTVVTAEAVRSF